MINKKFIIIPNPFFKNKFYINKSCFYNMNKMNRNIKSVPNIKSVKRSNIIFYNLIRKIQSQFYKKNSSKKSKFPNLNHLSYYIIGDPKYTKISLKLLIFLIPFYFFYNKREELNNILDKSVKNLIINYVCRNQTIIEKISWEILILVQQERIKQQMRNLIILDVLTHKGIRDDLYRIIKRETIHYLKSEDCRKELKNLLIKDVMRNEDIRNDLYSLIKQFITLKEINFLEDKLEKIMVDILNIEAIHNHVAKKVEVEAHKALRDENLIRLAVKIISNYFN